MNEESTKEESVKVRWTFDEAAAIAEHLHNDLGIDRCLFTLGGWTEGGYDCRHPDNLPANPECGGNDALAAAVRRIQALGYVASLHDNYQDMYRDAKSWNPDFLEKRPDGSLIRGGRWLGGRAYMVCAPKQVNWPCVAEPAGDPKAVWALVLLHRHHLAVDRAMPDPKHPIGRNETSPSRASFRTRRGKCSACSQRVRREWALPHSDFFEGLVGVAGRHFHNLKAAGLGAQVIRSGRWCTTMPGLLRQVRYPAIRPRLCGPSRALRPAAPLSLDARSLVLEAAGCGRGQA